MAPLEPISDLAQERDMKEAVKQLKRVQEPPKSVPGGTVGTLEVASWH